ncbi:MAG: hypothetical protein IT557_07505 [Alphaproteobacteria bacterium]|nr:hypothetical protein [Alphaproteobacteria bacterium]
MCSHRPEGPELQAQLQAAFDAGDLDLAARISREAIARDASDGFAWRALGFAQHAMNQHGAAIASFRRARSLGERDVMLTVNLAGSLYAMGEIEPAMREYKDASGDADPEAVVKAMSNAAVIAPGNPALANADILAIRRAWAQACWPHAPSAPVAAPPRDGKLRVGYVSSFFRARNWMKPVFGAINHHDRTRFEIHLLNSGADFTGGSGYADRDEDYVHNLGEASNARCADYIRALGLDLLVDLNGYSVPERLGLFILRPAPSIIGWFNLFATTAVPGFGHIIGDDAVIPPEEEKFYTERVWRVAGSYLAFQVLYPVPDVAPPPALANGYVTFGCLGSQYKITDSMVARWAMILARAPTARLHLRNGTLSDASCREALLARFVRCGADPARIEMAGGAEHYDFLAAYEHVDIALDTFPYNGGTTTTEAIWQGVPVLATEGDRWAARTSKSILRAGGLGEWCVADAEAYVERAAALANDPATPGMLAALRAGMRARLSASAACDCTALARGLEAIYAGIAGR